MVFSSFMHNFSRRNKLKLQFLFYSSRFFYLEFANTCKGEQSHEIRHSSFKNSEMHEAACSKIHRSALHSQYQYKQMSWGKTYEEEKLADPPLGNVFQLPRRRSPEGGINVGRTLSFFYKPFARHLIYSGTKSNTRKENLEFSRSATY